MGDFEDKNKISESVYSKQLKMACTPFCSYFPNMDCKTFTYREDGLKIRDDGKQFICGYDGHLITSWYDECPKVKDEIEILKERQQKQN